MTPQLSNRVQLVPLVVEKSRKLSNMSKACNALWIELFQIANQALDCGSHHVQVLTAAGAPQEAAMPHLLETYSCMMRSKVDEGDSHCFRVSEAVGQVEKVEGAIRSSKLMKKHALCVSCGNVPNH